MNKKRLRQIVMVLVVIYIIWKFLTGLIGGCGSADSSSVDHIRNRPWLEKMPADPREDVHAMFLMDRGRKVGAFAHGSAYRYNLDLVGWKINGDKLEVMFLQDQTKVAHKVRTWACEKEAPRPFNLCLELKGPDGTLRMYSRGDWERKDADDMPEQAKSMMSSFDDDED